MGAWSRVSPGDVFTLANGALGFLSITYILDRSFIVATALLLLSMVMDGLDGFMARKFGSKHAMGQVLDSISDSISFAIAPAMLIYAEFHDPARGSVFDSVEELVVLAAAVALLSTGLFRLARFSAGGFKLEHFVGMPAPAAALLIMLLCLLFGASEGAEPTEYYFTAAELPWLVLAFAFLASFLMASEISYPKVHGWLTALGALAVILAILPLTVGLAFVDDQDLYRASSRTAVSIALAFTLIYVFGGPVYEKLKGGKGG